MSSHENAPEPSRGEAVPGNRRDRSFSPSPPSSRRRSRSRSPRRRRDRSYSPDRRSRDYHRRHGPPPPGYRDYPPPPYDRDRDYYDYPPPPHHHYLPPHHHHHPHHHHPHDYPPPSRYEDRRGPPPLPRFFPPEDRPGPPPGRRDGRRREEGPPGVSLLVRNVSPDITVHDLQQAFGRIGDLRDVYIPRDYHSQQPKGFAFIEYANPMMAREARDEMNHFVIKGSAIEVVFAQERRKTPNEMRGRVVNPQNHRSSSFERHNPQQVDGKDERKDEQKEEQTEHGSKEHQS